MKRAICSMFVCLAFAVATAGANSGRPGRSQAGATGQGAPGTQASAAASTAPATDLTKASPDELLKVYAQLRDLSGSDQYAVAGNVTFKRGEGTFTFKDGRLAFAAPLAGHVVAAVFTGQGTFELDPPTAIDRYQLSRFTKQPNLVEGFRDAVFFFTDDSWQELQKLVKVQSGGDAAAATKTLQSAERKYAEDFNGWIDNRRKDNPEMRNLPARMLADLTDPLSRGMFLADFKGDGSGDLLYHVSWNRQPIVPAAVDTNEEVMLVRYKLNEYSEWWSGFHLSGEYTRSPHPEHRTLIAHCGQESIDAEISKDNHLSGTAAMEFEVPEGTARVLPLNLDGVLRVSVITDDAGKKLSFIQEDRKLDSDLWLILPEAPAPGQTAKVKIAYEEDSTHDSRVIQQQGSGLYFVGARESWYPSFGAFDDRTNFKLHFRSPKKYTFVATGRRLSEKKEGDGIESDWESEMPYNVVGFNYGDFVDKTQSDPNLTVTVYAGRDVPDELKGVTAAIEQAQFAQHSGGVGGGVGRRQSNVEADSGILTGGFNTTGMAGYAAGESYQAFKLYEHYFGPLPFKTISVTEQPVGSFGQSWPTLIYLPYLSLLDTTTRHSLRLEDTAEGREFFDEVAVHEMSHQWWGHMVGWKTYHDQWLSEGFADFSAALYFKTFEPQKLKPFWDLARFELLSNNRVGQRPTDVGPLWLNGQLGGYLQGLNRTLLVYKKGAYVLEMLRALMEDPRSPDPDAKFIAMMHDFVVTYTGKNPSTEDFQRVAEKHFGGPLDWFFNEWVYGTEVPRYDFAYELKDAAGGKTTLHFSLQQSEVSDSFMMRVPFYVWVKGAPHRLGFIVAKGPATSTGDIPLPFRPDKVTIDEYHSILATEK